MCIFFVLLQAIQVASVSDDVLINGETQNLNGTIFTAIYKQIMYIS